MKISIKKLSVAISFYMSLIFICMIMFGQFEFGSNDHTLTLSSILASSPIYSFVYSIFICIYVIFQFLLLIIIYKEPKSCTNKNHHIILSRIIILSSIIHLIGLIVIVFVPVDKYFESHIIIASFVFFCGIFKSFLLFIRRLLNINKYILWTIYLNAFNVCMLIITGIVVVITHEGWVEWVLILFILFENIWYAIDYNNKYISISVI